MPDSTRKDILDALTSKLTGITTGAGYRRTVTTVDYAGKDWGEIPESLRDWIGIIPQSEAFQDFPGHVQSTWSIDLVCHLTPSAATATAVMEAIVNSMTDIRRALMTSPSNLGVDGVHFVRIASRRGTESDPEAVLQGVASNVIGIEVVFEEGLTDT